MRELLIHPGTALTERRSRGQFRWIHSTGVLWIHRRVGRTRADAEAAGAHRR